MIFRSFCVGGYWDQQQNFINLMMMSTRQMTSDFVMYFMMTIMNVKRLKFLMKLKYM